MEQSYKEKYEDILTRLERAKNDDEVCDERFCCVIDDLIPELAESKNEKIRREVINYFHCQSEEEPTRKEIHNKWIAWLEKQELKSNPYSGVSFNYNGNTWGMCARDNGVDISCDKHLIKHLEKQGEQPQKTLIWKHWKNGIAGNGEGKLIYLVKVGNTYKITSCLGFECDYIELSELDKLLSEKQGEQKFEMKTAEESLGIDSDTYNKIIDECIFGEQNPTDSYCQENCKGFQETGKCFADGECKAKREAEQNLAENAKPQSSTPMSYGKELEKRMCEACNRFYAPNTDSNRYSASDLFYAGVKAERDLNTLAWSEDDETTKNNISHIIRQYDKISKRENEPCWYIGDCLLWMQNIKGRVQPKQEWTEEEIEPIISDYLCGREHYGGMIGRLCHLKPKQKQTEWSEDDKAFLDDILCKLEHDLVLNKDEKDWLKSIRPQNRWKPSELQLGCLSDAIEHYNSLGYPAPKLKELLDDLKKLKGEV